MRFVRCSRVLPRLLPGFALALRAPIVVAAVLVAAVLVAAVLVAPGGARAQDAAALTRAQELFRQGIAAYDAGRLDEAARLLTEADGIVHSPELSFNIARVYERMGEAPQAIRWFQRYLREAHPSDEERADIERRMQLMRELQQRQRDQVMILPPSDDEMTQEARTFFERGVAMFRRRRYDAALQAFTAAYNFARLPEVIYNLAVASERTGHTQDAIDYYREYLRARPDGSDRVMVERHIEQLRQHR